MIPSPTDYDDFDPYHSTSWGRLEYQVATTARLYFDFAVQDIENEKSERALVNALSNAKRALHLQVETLANALGFKIYSSKKRPNFHDYVGFCEKAGVVTPRILRKLNSIRNAVEHDYYIPDVSEVEDFIDVVELFLSATDRFFFQFPLDAEFLPRKKVKDDAPDIHSIKLEAYSGEIRLITYGVEREIKVSAKDESYYNWLHVLIEKVHRG